MTARAASQKRAPTAPAAAAEDEASVYLLYGTEEFLVAENARRIVDGLCPPDQQTLGMEEVDGRADTEAAAEQALRACLAAVRTPAFLSPRKVVWFRDVAFLDMPRITGGRSAGPWFAELTELIKAGLPSGHALVITAESVDGRTAFAKACKAHGRVFEFPRPGKPWELQRQAEAVAADALRAAGLEADYEARQEFADRVGVDRRAAHQEAEKVSVYLGDRRAATAADIRDIVSATREAEAFALADAVGRRHLGAALAVLRMLLDQGEEPIALVAALDSRFRDLAVLREALDRGWVRLAGNAAEWTDGPEVDAALGALAERDPRAMHAYRAGILLDTQAQRFDAAELSRAERDILRTREQLVSGFGAPRLLLEFLVLKLAAPRPGARRGGIQSVKTGGIPASGGI